MKVLLIGLGKMGQYHLQNLLDIETIEHIYAFDFFSETFKIPSSKITYSTILENFDSLDFDFVDIVAPSRFHFSYLEKYIKMKKNIFIEKPIVVNYEEFQKLENIIQELGYNKHIAVGFIERYNVVSEFLKKEITQRGDPKQVEIFRYNPASDRIEDVQVTEDLMIHDIDLIHYLLGEKPLRVLGKNTQKETSTVLLQNGTTQVVLSANSITQQKIREIKIYYPELTIIGNLTLAKIDFFHKPSVYLSEKGQDLSVSYMVDEKILMKNNQLKDELKEFIDMLEGRDARRICTFLQAKKSMDLLYAILS